jgi:putative ABC transport system permease protein
MTLIKYIVRNARRNGLRTTLTMLSVGCSLAMMTVLYGYLAMQKVWSKQAEQHHRFVVMNVMGFAGEVPIAYVDRVAQTKGVKAAVPYSWFGGTYKEETMTFAQFGTDPKRVFEVWDEFSIDPKELAAFQDDRRGCVADRRLAERRGWKIGERIPLKGTFYPVNLDLVLVGMFDAPQPTESLWFHWQYIDESLRQGGYEEQAGNAGIIFAKAESAEAIPGLCKAIDDRFGSSENPTRSQTEAAFAQMFTDMLGNVQGYIRFICLVVMVALTLVAANAMAMSMRERTTEIAVLKAIGFPRGRVLNMILGESCLVAGIGGLIGLAMGGACLQAVHGLSPQMFPMGLADLLGPWMLAILAAGIGIGLVSGIVPATRAAQLSVVDGLRRVI